MGAAVLFSRGWGAYISVRAEARLFASFVLVLAPFDGPLLDALAICLFEQVQGLPDQRADGDDREDARQDDHQPPRGWDIGMRTRTAAR